MRLFKKMYEIFKVRQLINILKLCNLIKMICVCSKKCMKSLKCAYYKENILFLQNLSGSICIFIEKYPILTQVVISLIFIQNPSGTISVLSLKIFLF